MYIEKEIQTMCDACKQSKGKYYLTTAIAYTSRKPHIGNTYEVVRN